MRPMVRIVPLFLVVTLAFAFARPVEAQVVVSQLYGGGGNSGATLKADFVELFNRGGDPLALDGWSVQYASASASSWQVSGLSGTLQPGHYYLVQMAEGSGGTVDLPSPDAVGVSNLSATSGKVALVRDSSALDGDCPLSPGIEDFIGYGTASCFEGQAAASAANNTNALWRKGDGCEDSNENAVDFETASPAPRNQQSALGICGPAVTTPSPTLTSTALSSATPSTTPTETPMPSETPSASAAVTPSRSPSRTASSTATRTAMPTSTTSGTSTSTRSPTVTQTPSPTASFTASSSATPETPGGTDAVCGNGEIEVGEQCDDGNNDDGDLCPSSAASGCSYLNSGALIHGNERRLDVRRDGCQLEWYVADPQLNRRRSGTVSRTQICTDQDPTCDFDPMEGRCRFMVVACLNNTDPSLPACEPRALSAFRILHPGTVRSTHGTGIENRRALEEAFAALRDPANPEQGAIHGFPLSSLQTNLCSLPIPLYVRRVGNGRRSMNVIVETFRDGEKAARWQRSRLRLICMP